MPGPANKSKKKGTGKTKTLDVSESSSQLNAANPNQCSSFEADDNGTMRRNRSHKVKGTGNSKKSPNPIQCLTLEEDEMTRCNQPATEGYPRPERCKVHQNQYRLMYKKYKDASKVVDDVKSGRELPTKQDIERYTNLDTTLEKIRWLRKYLESIRVERTGRDIHQRRFFLKADDGHKKRIKALAKKMVTAVEILSSLQERALDLYVASNPGCDWMRPVQLPKNFGSTVDPIPTETIVEAAQPKIHLPNYGSKTRMLSAPRSSEPADEDLIDLEHQAQKNRLLHGFKMFMDPECVASFYHDEMGLDTSDPSIKTLTSIFQDVLQQYARRIIFHEPDLFFKSLDKVSFKDLLLADDFSNEDVAKFSLLFQARLGFGLVWFKDAVIDALVMSKKGTAANIGKLSSRHQVLGGWIYNCAHTHTIPHEAWWHMLTLLEPPADVENRFVRLCNNFDDMINFLSFGAIGMVPPPTFCSGQYYETDAVASRKHLSLSGVVVTDMVSSPRAQYMNGPIPTTRRGKMPGCIVWRQLETRAHMFGALRNEPDLFNDAFLRELQARPDLFQVVTRSETDPGHDVQVFGAGPTNALPAMRHRQFEAPPAPFANRPTGSGEWMVSRSAVDVLYGTHAKMPGAPKQPFPGYLQILNGGKSRGWFFRFKKFPVKYIAILDTIPNRHSSVLARNVAWAALRAGGYGEGEYDARMYARASDKLFQKRAEEILAWMPESCGGWKATKMEDGFD
ncbi:hypothetical protein K503DRAFT_770624 [Rhizopogon vinicolor AM-OR11-026]|uniref:Uncharacterized protein n=1 Tax=Rhizopogon vinicolor AM-OR11-026 TaxID=1314800 RepID=A0A1B7N0B3_9AGAM|nr:hypothetical protein K503DRAFT_770624 [Rhizopogon vinicolor AM-OR11-026]